MRKFLVIIPVAFLCVWYVWELSPGLALFVGAMVALFWAIEIMARKEK